LPAGKADKMRTTRLAQLERNSAILGLFLGLVWRATQDESGHWSEVMTLPY
jgi:hypothetical protein